MTTIDTRRRRFLRWAAGAGGIGLAGCSGDGGGDGETQTPLTTTTERSTTVETTTATEQTTTTEQSSPTESSYSFIPDRRSEWFGHSVALNGLTALIGAPRSSISRENEGAAHVFEWSGGNWRQTVLTANDGDRYDNFGKSVALSGATAFVSASNAEEGTGKVYIFRRSGGEWSQQATLTVADSEQFGSSVTIADDIAVIGALADDGNSGAAYVFERSDESWVQQAKLIAKNPNGDDFFAKRVAAAGDTVLIGASHRSREGRGEEAGAVYVFKRSGDSWTQQTKIFASDLDSGDWFGSSVAVADDTVLIGAAGDEDPNGKGAGSVYVFERSDGRWRQQVKLTANDGKKFDRFGRSVAMANDTILVGAPAAAKFVNGFAYLFKRENKEWVQQTKLTLEKDKDGAKFGWSVSLNEEGTRALIGARRNTDSNGNEVGSAHVFTL